MFRLLPTLVYNHFHRDLSWTAPSRNELLDFITLRGNRSLPVSCYPLEGRVLAVCLDFHGQIPTSHPFSNFWTFYCVIDSLALYTQVPPSFQVFPPVFRRSRTQSMQVIKFKFHHKLVSYFILIFYSIC